MTLTIWPNRGEFYFSAPNVVKYRVKMPNAASVKTIGVYTITDDLNQYVGASPPNVYDGSTGTVWSFNESEVSVADFINAGLNNPAGGNWGEDVWHDFPITEQGIAFNISTESGFTFNAYDNLVLTPEDGTYIYGNPDYTYRAPTLDSFDSVVVSGRWSIAQTIPWRSGTMFLTDAKFSLEITVSFWAQVEKTRIYRIAPSSRTIYSSINAIFQTGTTVLTVNL